MDLHVLNIYWFLLVLKCHYSGRKEEQEIKVDDLEWDFRIFTVKYPGHYGVTFPFESVRMYMNEVE